jgi:hypothetical protein
MALGATSFRTFLAARRPFRSLYPSAGRRALRSSLPAGMRAWGMGVLGRSRASRPPWAPR